MAEEELDGFSETEKDEIELEDIDSEIEDSKSSPGYYEITTYPADYTLEVLLTKWRNNEIIIPSFQRKFVWTLEQSSKLIESFIMGLPVPAIFFYRETESQKYLVIDGHQRLKSIIFYIEGFFGDNFHNRRSVFRLKNLNEKSRLNGLAFTELSEIDQRKLKNAILRVFIVIQNNPKDNSSIFHIFERLNTGGTRLNNQEIRNCVYHGKLNNWLIEQNNYRIWRKIVGKNTFDKRMRDIEILLRFISLHKHFETYKRPMRQFLNNFMKKYRNPTDNFLLGLEKIFQKTCDVIITELGEKPFHLRRSMNIPVFDSVSLIVSRNLESIPNDLHGKYRNLVSNEEFQELSSSGTTEADNIKRRFEIALKMLIKE